MDAIPKDRILESKPDTLTYVRKQYNLDKPGEMKEAVKILHDWVQQQKHFKKKDFGTHYYESSIIGYKGSIERAKNQIDKMCTLRTLLPQFFINCNPKTDFGNLYEAIYVSMLPKLTDDHYRVYMTKFNESIIESTLFMEYYRYNICMAEYIKVHDYINGFILITDLSESNLVDILTKMSPNELRQFLSIQIEGFGIRIKSIHMISPSKVINTLVAIIKQALSPKIANRIHIHKNIEELYKYIPKEILPKDCGGEERTLKELHNEWLEVLSSEEHMKYMQEMNAASTDEDLRQKCSFNEQYAGMPGTFRVLTVD